MTLSFGVNILAVIVGTVISFILGWLWYGPFFGKQWMRAANMSKGSMDEASIVTSLIMTFITFYIAAVFMKASGAATLLSGAFVGVLIWLGFFLVKSVDGVLWEKKKMAFLYIGTAYDLVRFMIVGAILAAWM